MSLQSKISVFGTLFKIAGSFLSRPRPMISLYQRNTLPFVFKDIDFRDFLGPGFHCRLEMHLAPDTYGDVSSFELLVLSSLVAKFRPRRIFEFGTFMGKTTQHLAANAPEDGQVFTLDLPESNFETVVSRIPYDKNLLAEGKRKRVGHYFRESKFENKIEQIFANSSEFDESPYADSMDMVFVDADHTYSSVLNDTRKALHMLKKEPGKLILWHDLRQKSDVEKAIADVLGREKVFHIKDTMLAVYAS